jgi:hypothetical protein
MMMAVMISALVVNWFRPVAQAEAEKIAERRFLKVPVASQWVGRYRVHSWSAGTKNCGGVWIVHFTESGDGTHLPNMTVTSKGEIHALGVTSGKFK